MNTPNGIPKDQEWAWTDHFEQRLAKSAKDRKPLMSQDQINRHTGAVLAGLMLDLAKAHGVTKPAHWWKRTWRNATRYAVNLWGAICGREASID